mmetsp:Transcript_16353/g.40204  ORF Transcript_16353/g.40204 Transcript_16353/m.40204 type:complete len:212 (-) Transcript_16353:207-842(-)
MSSSTSLQPITSSRLYPMISAALWFHSLTLPCLSIPMIGAIVVSLSSRRFSARRFCSRSALLRSVMSFPTTTTPVMSPFASRRVVTFSSTSTRAWLLAKSGNSKFAVSRPCSALSSAPFVCTRKAGLMNSSTKSRPIASSNEYPTISAALRFHSLTLPSLSIPKMGLLALSINSRRSSSCATRFSSPSSPVLSMTSCLTLTTPVISPFASR